ncbi:MAG: class I SAM-dependent methyltransferase [Acidimicrobiaceae bacterium]|nr:class I SAM-dependent methyltransferase [Acidimicrobiaceae bacterium]
MSTTSNGVSWDDRYAGSEFAFGTKPNDFLRECVESTNIASEAIDILCIGDGEGRNGVFLATAGHRVTTVDLSLVGVRKGRDLAKQHGVTVNSLVADLDNYDLENTKWDLVVSIFCHMPPTLRTKVHRNIVSALRPGGSFLREAYRPANVGRGVGGPQNPELCVTLVEIETQFSDFSFVIAREVERYIAEGKFHSGFSATTQVLVRKPH